MDFPVIPKRVGGEVEVDAISMLSSKVDAMSQKLERLDINSTSSNTPSPSYEIYGAVDHLTMNCQVGSPFAPNASEPVNYVNNFNSRPTIDPFSDTYNHSWRNHPNFSYSSNVPPMPQMNFRSPIGFQGPPYPTNTSKIQLRSDDGEYAFGAAKAR